ncbi:SGNH/GDSL hydrolase family protein [Rudaeicoccus suwonensis]|uniref:Lysophospholipase L1-like esterase n=1 Tax=Rudaeicoccus suwonensis TaxID=657409 RepID=A0A561E897_9MICO|nr:SGNH/GDSL hydrolase family protein [Rudaeicoccus suwonensis]TWE11841.1 lysophospholipase L1-like esterase [Rudaeicoccus suwonensis]
MGRARRARKIASRAAYGGGIGAAGLIGAGLTTWGLLLGESVIARRIVGQPFDGAPDSNGTYGAGPGEPIQLLVIGDSTARGMGADEAHQTVGAIIAATAAALAGRPVHLTNVAVVGAVSTDLTGQVEQALEAVPAPDAAIIMIGANDVTSRLPRATSVRHLSAAVLALREAGAEVIVGTCPDLGVIQPVPQPLRTLARRWSRDLAAAQTVAVIEHGGRTVSLGDLLGPEFSKSPAVMFSADRFHPSAAGYARAASALLPSVLDALGQSGVDDRHAPDIRRRETVGPVSVAATRAVADPGTEVSGTDVHGSQRGSRGRWAVLMRRQRTPLQESDAVEAEQPTGDASSELPADDPTAVGTDHNGIQSAP